MYGSDESLLRCFYLLLQMAHLIMPLVEKGSLLRRAAEALGKSVIGLYRSLRNIARFLLACLRYVRIPEEAYNPTRRIQIRFDTS